MTEPLIAIAGCPNVGKSTLFNLLSVGGKAIVHATAGVTRDVRKAPAELGNLTFNLLDTAGLDPHPDDMETTFNAKAREAWATANAIIFMLDGGRGITAADEDVAATLRKLGKPVVVAVNKGDLKTAEDVLTDVLALGFGEGILVAAAHNEGLFELEEALQTTNIFNKDCTLTEEDLETSSEEQPDDGVIPLAIVGRPNAGKSTLVNALLKDDRMVTGPVAGLTRESIGTRWQWEGRDLELVDTPGIRKKTRVVEKLEQMSVGDALQAVDKAQAVILVLDATTYDPDRKDSGPLEKQDMVIAAHVVDAGKPLLIALNKWDAIKEKEECLAYAQHQLTTQFSQVKHIPIIQISALKSKGVEALLPSVFDLHAKWSARWGTAPLNRFLETLLETNHPPMRKGRRVKLKFMSQVGERPPTFAIWCNMPKAVPQSYIRMFKNRLCESFGLEGIVVRVMLKGGDNPFHKK